MSSVPLSPDDSPPERTEAPRQEIDCRLGLNPNWARPEKQDVDVLRIGPSFVRTLRDYA